MRQLFIISFLLIFSLIFFAEATSAQERPPAILIFELTEDVKFTVYEVEYDVKLAEFTWLTVNLTPEYQLVLEAYMVDDWSRITNDDPLPPSTTDYEAVLYHPLNFGSMMYRLSIQDEHERIYDQRFLEIAFAPTEDMPTITMFTVNSVEVVNSQVFNAEVNWEIANRRPNTNLEFDQLMPDGSTNHIELPRTNLWVASFGRGIIQPAYVTGDVVVRLRVIDLIDRTVYAETQRIIEPPAVTNVQPTSQPTSIVDTAPTPTPFDANAPQLVSLTINPNPVNRTEPFVVSWEVTQASSVTAIVQHFIYKGNSWSPLTDKSITGFAVGETSFSLADIHYVLGSLRIHLDVIGEDGQTYAFASEPFDLTCFPMVAGTGYDCSTYPRISTNASFQQFEQGVMIWRADTNQVYVMGGPDTTGFFWQRFPVSAGSSSATPPNGLFSPEGAFAGIWANNANVQGIGWATAPLQTYTTEIQYSVTGNSSNSLFMTTPQGILNLIAIGGPDVTSGPSWRFLE